MRFLLYIVPVLLALYALVECGMTPSESMPYNIPKPFWFLLIILFTVIGPLAWIVLLRIERAEKGEPIPSARDVVDQVRQVATGSQSASEEPQSPQAHTPDDDAEYLERIERQIKREKLARQREADKEAERLRRLRDQQGGDSSRPHDSDTDTTDSDPEDGSDSNSH